MCRVRWVLSLVALCVGLAHSWGITTNQLSCTTGKRITNKETILDDIAVSLGPDLVFYTKGSKTNTVRFKSQNLTALTYDEVHDMMLYVDNQRVDDAICSYHLNSKENKCFIKRNSSNIHSIAFDPATDTLFFTDTDERSVNWVSLKPGSNNNVNLLIKMDVQIPTNIAVDSCRGYIYWANIDDVGNSRYIERARFNGSERKVMYEYMPVITMAMDPQTRKVYFFDGIQDCFLNGKSLDDEHEDFLVLGDTDPSKARELTVSNGYLYWMNSSGSYKTVWQIPKNNMNVTEIKEISKFYNETPIGIAANYKIKDQIQGLQDCEALSSLLPTITNHSAKRNLTLADLLSNCFFSLLAILAAGRQNFSC